jgi:hypothetical protein
MMRPREEQPVTTRKIDCKRVGLSILAAWAIVVREPTSARAQYGFGFGGFGWGFGIGRTVPAPIEYLNSKSLVDASRGYTGPSATPYAGNSNAYFNHIRDNGLVERYSVARHEPSYYRYPSAPPPALGATSSAAPTPDKPMLPLTSFYDAEGRLVWPADSPTSGDLKQKQDTFDRSSLAVLDETKKSGVASLASVTDARQKLLEYGRPALQYIRSHQTPRVADTFHLFLLSLYESLAQAVNPPQAAGRSS